MDFEEAAKPYQEVCDVCHQTIIAYKSESGLVKFRCPNCGTITAKRYKSKYHFIKDVRRPRR